MLRSVSSSAFSMGALASSTGGGLTSVGRCSPILALLRFYPVLSCPVLSCPTYLSLLTSQSLSFSLLPISPCLLRPSNPTYSVRSRSWRDLMRKSPGSDVAWGYTERPEYEQVRRIGFRRLQSMRSYCKREDGNSSKNFKL